MRDTQSGIRRETRAAAAAPAFILLRNRTEHTLTVLVPSGATYAFAPGESQDVPSADAETLIRTGLLDASAAKRPAFVETRPVRRSPTRRM